jgi:polysaccharide export outer membrane protein
MNQSFGPWSSSLNSGINPQLDTFWIRRLAMLPALNQAPSGRTRIAVIVVAALAVGALALPTIRWVSRLPENERALQLTGDAKPADVPTERQKRVLPVYRVEPPDVLVVEIVRGMRPARDLLRGGDELLIRASNTLPIDPHGDPAQNEFKTINGPYLVQSDGTVDLGPEYGSVVVAGLTVTAARGAIEKHLREYASLFNAKVAVSLPDVSAQESISGERLVRPDGTISLGSHGIVYVNDLTLEEVKAAVEARIASTIDQPVVRVDVAAYNSKVVYVVSDGADGSEEIIRLPFVGNDTVLDALSQVEGLSDATGKNEIWVARPAGGKAAPQRMPVDWRKITQDADTATNYQLLPGDRIYVKGSRLRPGRQANVDRRRAGRMPLGETQ